MPKELDIKLNYSEIGSGEYLIFLHGNGESKEYFAHQMGFFGYKYHVIALDTRGHGGTPRGSGEFSISRFANDLYLFMIENGIAKANILGFSDGGNIALTFALRHPEMVTRLILNGANLFPRGVKTLYQLPIELSYKVLKVFEIFSSAAKEKAELLGLMVNEPNIKPQELAKLNMPVLVIAGSKDMIKDEHTKLIATSLPNATLQILQGDHFVANKNHDIFNACVLNFLDK